MRNPARERSRNPNREVWESPSVYGGEDVNLRILVSHKDNDRVVRLRQWGLLKGRIIAVVHTEREDYTRIISARKAKKYEI